LHISARRKRQKHKRQRERDVGEMPDLINKYSKMDFSRVLNFAFATGLAYTSFVELGGGASSAPSLIKNLYMFLKYTQKLN